MRRLKAHIYIAMKAVNKGQCCQQDNSLYRFLLTLSKHWFFNSVAKILVKISECFKSKQKVTQVGNTDFERKQESNISSKVLTTLTYTLDAFLRKAYWLHEHILEMIETVMTTPRLHLTAWHLPLCKSYLAQQFIDLKQCLEQKSNQFFLRYIIAKKFRKIDN